MKILFLSASDFKEKSIQVIRITPEAYARRGWQVKYIVARDSARIGNYGYEPIVDPPGVDVTRFEVPLRRLRDRAGLGTYRWLTKLAYFLALGPLAWRGFREARRNGPYDVIYGYECWGTLAAAIVRLLLRCTFSGRRTRYVSRFQGVWSLYEAVESKRYWKLLKEPEKVLAAYLPFDLCIMTNDGTRGLAFLRWLKARSRQIRYYVNGVDPRRPADPATEPAWTAWGIGEEDRVILCVSRLVAGKRLDRALRALACILRDRPSGLAAGTIKLLIVGGGMMSEELRKLAVELGVAESVVFTGPVPHDSLGAYYRRADFFFSFYDVSNVGNPLLEAIRYHKIIFTLCNGETGEWIRDGVNGFLFEPDDASLPKRVAATFWRLESDVALRARIAEGVAQTEATRLWTWQDRMNAEIDSVEALHAA